MADPGVLAQQAAEAHLAAIDEAEEALDTDPDAEVEHPAVGPWCGCQTCVVREVLAVAWPILLAGVADRLHELREPVAARRLLHDEANRQPVLVENRAPVIWL